MPYVADMGFTHVELLPITEHPFGGSWGYQPLSLFAPSSPLWDPGGFRAFRRCCARGRPRRDPRLGAGAFSDGSAWPRPLRRYRALRISRSARGVSPRLEHLIYNFGRREVQGFLIASALFWLERFHVDGLRVDAVASMLYRDYSRQDRRMGAQTSTAAGKISRRSRSCGISMRSSPSAARAPS